MEKYIEIRIVSAKPLGNGEVMVYRPEGMRRTTKEEFQKTHLWVRQAIWSITDEKPTISEQMARDFIQESKRICVGERTVVVVARLKNGMEIAEAHTFAESDLRDDFKADEKCFGKIVRRVEEMLKFMVQSAICGMDAAYKHGAK